MSNERLFLDTVFVIGLLNPNDQHHGKAKELFPRFRAAGEVWTTDAILVEIGNGLRAIQHRQTAVRFIQQCFTNSRMRIVPVTTDLLKRALNLYESHEDKTWGLTDCISFVVMDDETLTDAITTDGHFQQAGFRALMQD